MMIDERGEYDKGRGYNERRGYDKRIGLDGSRWCQAEAQSDLT